MVGWFPVPSPRRPALAAGGRPPRRDARRLCGVSVNRAAPDDFPVPRALL
jgi:hypothetical protein